MKIGINASYAVSERPTGIGNYIINLIRSILRLDKENQYFLYYRQKIKRENYLDFNLPAVKFEPHFSWLSCSKIDIFHDPSFKYIKMGRSINIVTIHDIVVALKEDYTSERFKKRQYPKLLKAVKMSDRIIAISEFTKSELIKFFTVRPEKISVIHPGVAPVNFPAGEKEPDLIRKYNIPGRYLLFVGNIEKRKNLFNIIKSFEKVIQKEKELFLVLVGKNGYSGEQIRDFIKQSPAGRNIIELDYVPNDELHLIYRNAELLLFTSCYEGFGLPILEALSCGCPVITSNVSSMPEAGGDAVLYADPFRIEDIAEKTLFLLNNSRLKNELIKKGLERVKKNTWDHTAEKTIELYKKVIEK